MSIFKKITILFFISVVIMTTIGIWIDKINEDRVEKLVKEKYIQISQDILQSIENKAKIKQIIKKYNLKSYHTNDKLDTLYFRKNSFGYIKISKELFDDEFIIQINYLDENLIYETTDLQSLTEQKILNILVIVDIIVLVLIFLYIYKLLSPLKIISKKLKDFSQGKLKSRIDITTNDEIGVLANSFNDMASTLEQLINTKEEILRDIAHELRTPIAKGKFVIQNIQNINNKNLLKSIFNDLENLTNTLIEIEKLNINKLNYSNFNIETLVIESLQKLYMNDESKINIKIDNFNIRADLYFLTISLKNIISNALKYTTKFPIIIEAKEGKISVKSYGKRLENNLNYYTKPFTKDNEKDGFGLGLSIVDKIVKKHRFRFLYKYQDSMNIFTLYTN